MTKMTRRKLLQALGLSAIVGTSACDNKCGFSTTATIAVALIETAKGGALRGQIGLLLTVLTNLLLIRDEPGSGSRRGAGVVTIGTGSPSDSVGGPNPLPSAPANSRAVYILDTEGDNTADGRLIAVTASESSVTVRGQVVLRAVTEGAPNPDLRDAALSTDGRLLVVSQAGAPAQWIFVDTVSLTILGRLNAPAGLTPVRAVISPDSKLVYALAAAGSPDATPVPQNSIQVLDVATRTVSGSFNLPNGVTFDDVAVTPDDGLLFGCKGGSLHIIDLATRTYSGNVPALPPPGETTAWSGTADRMAMSPSGDRLYVSMRGNPSGNSSGLVAKVGVFDVRTAAKLTDLPLRNQQGNVATHVALSPSGTTLIAGMEGGSEVQVFDAELGYEIVSIPADAEYSLEGVAVA